MDESQPCNTCRFYGAFGTCTRDYGHVVLNCKRWAERWDDMASRLETELATTVEALGQAQRQVEDQYHKDMAQLGETLAREAAVQQQLAEAQAEAAVMRSVLSGLADCKGYSVNEIRAALSGTAGKQLLDELARLRAFVADMRKTYPLSEHIQAEIAALDAGGKGQ